MDERHRGAVGVIFWATKEAGTRYRTCGAARSGAGVGPASRRRRHWQSIFFAYWKLTKPNDLIEKVYPMKNARIEIAALAGVVEETGARGRGGDRDNAKGSG